MCVEDDLEVRSCNYCCSGKAISRTHKECVFIALGLVREMRTLCSAT